MNANTTRELTEDYNDPYSISCYIIVSRDDDDDDPYSCSWNDYKYREMVSITGGLTPEKDELARKHRSIHVNHGQHLIHHHGDEMLATIFTRCLGTDFTENQPPSKLELGGHIHEDELMTKRRWEWWRSTPIFGDLTPSELYEDPSPLYYTEVGSIRYQEMESYMGGIVDRRIQGNTVVRKP
jgi:hypothetical protein